MTTNVSSLFTCAEETTIKSPGALNEACESLAHAETQCDFCDFLFDESPFAITFWDCEKSCGLERIVSPEPVSYYCFKGTLVKVSIII